MKNNKKQTPKPMGWDIHDAMIFSFIAGAVIVTLLLTGARLYAQQHDDRICVGSYQGVSVEMERNLGIVVFDLNDKTHLQVFTQIQQYFRQYSQAYNQLQSMKGGNN